MLIYSVGRLTYTNEQGMSFFRNRNYWYLGDLTTWPPETHYRCVGSDDQCGGINEILPFPSSTGGWTSNKRFGSETLPEIVRGPCVEEKTGNGEL